MSRLRRFLLFRPVDTKLVKNSDRLTSAAALSSRGAGSTSSEYAHAEWTRTVTRLIIR